MSKIEITVDQGDEVVITRRPPPAPAFPVGFNVTSDSYYDGAGKMANALVEAAYTAGPPTALGFPAAGKAINYLVFSENRFLWGQYKPGTYLVKGTGSGAKLTAWGAAVGTAMTFQTVKGQPFRWPVTLAPMPAPSGDQTLNYQRVQQFVLAVDGGTTAAPSTDLPDLMVCHQDDEAHIDAGGPGSWFTLDALRDYTTASKGPLRMMQWVQTSNGTFMQDEADIPVHGAVAIATGWSSASGSDGRRGTLSRKLPSPEQQAGLCVATGMPLWLNVMPQMTDAAMLALYQRVAAIYTAGLVFVELGNEPWNSKSGYWATNVGYLGTYYATAGQPGEGSGIAMTKDQPAVNAALGHASLRAWKIAEQVFGAARVRRVMNVQLGWIDNSITSLTYVDPGIIQAGQPVGKLMHAACVSTYLGITPDKWQTGPGSSRGVVAPGFGLGVSWRWMMQNPSKVDAPFIRNGMLNSVDQVAYFVGLWKTKLAALGFPTGLIEYEGHQPDISTAAGTVGTQNSQNGDGVSPAADPSLCVAYSAADGSLVPSTGTINGKVFPDAGESLAAWFADGEIVCATWVNQTSGVTQSRGYACRIIGGKLYLFDTWSKWSAGLGSQVLGGSSCTFLLCNVTRFQKLAELINATWWGSDGAAVLDYQHASLLGLGFLTAAGFKCVGSAMHPFYIGAGYPAQMSTSAYKPHGHFSPSTPVMTRYAQLT